MAERNREDSTCRWFDAGQKPRKGGGGREEGEGRKWGIQLREGGGRKKNRGSPTIEAEAISFPV